MCLNITDDYITLQQQKERAWEFILYTLVPVKCYCKYFCWNWGQEKKKTLFSKAWIHGVWYYLELYRV